MLCAALSVDRTVRVRSEAINVEWIIIIVTRCVCINCRDISKFEREPTIGGDFKIATPARRLLINCDAPAYVWIILEWRFTLEKERMMILIYSDMNCWGMSAYF